MAERDDGVDEVGGLEGLADTIANLHESLERWREELRARHAEHARVHEELLRIEGAAGPWNDRP